MSEKKKKEKKELSVTFRGDNAAIRNIFKSSIGNNDLGLSMDAFGTAHNFFKKKRKGKGKKK